MAINISEETMNQWSLEELQNNSVSEPELLVAAGRAWASEVRYGNGNGRQIINAIHNHPTFGLRVRARTGYQSYDPVSRILGSRAASYNSIISRVDDPVNDAEEFRDWMDNESSILSLPRHLQELAVVTHFSEVGRSYQSELPQLRNMVDNIIDGEASWTDIHEYYPPSLTYREDVRADWSDDEEHESDDEEYEDEPLELDSDSDSDSDRDMYIGSDSE